MTVEKLVALALITALLTLLLRSSRPEQGMILSMLAASLLLLWILQDMAPLLNELQALFQKLPIPGTYWELLLKSLGICLLVQTGAELCRDAGVSALGAKIELAGKVSVLLLCLPFFRQLLELVTRLLT